MLFRVPSSVVAAPLAAALLLSGCMSNRGVETAEVVGRTYEGPLCPAIVVQSGAQARVVYSATNATDPQHVRYQVGILEVSRSCTVLNDVVSVTINVSGRFVGGPAVQAGTVRDTLRAAIVGDGGIVVSQQDFAISGTLAAPVFGQDFHVTQSIIAPVPPAGTVYRVMVGIDQG